MFLRCFDGVDWLLEFVKALDPWNIVFDVFYLVRESRVSICSPIKM